MPKQLIAGMSSIDIELGSKKPVGLVRARR
jgi:hypothetical protein